MQVKKYKKKMLMARIKEVYRRKSGWTKTSCPEMVFLLRKIQFMSTLDKRIKCSKIRCRRRLNYCSSIRRSTR